MTETPPTVDPRFDPRFQRGYSASASTSPRPSRESSGPVPVASRPAPVEVPAFARPVVERIPAEPPTPERPVPRMEPTVTLETELDEPLPVNPWRVALLVVSLGLIALAAGAMWVVVDGSVFATTSFSSASSAAMQYVLQQVLVQAPPGLISAGVLGVVAWIALGALWPRSPR
jgi:hypothetical protein